MDRKSPELIEQDMHETRQALTDKVAALEQQVVGTIHEATTAVQDTVQSVKSAVEDTVTNVKDTVSESVASVKSTLDVPEHVRSHPWAGIGVAALAGAVTGYLLSSEQKTSSRPAQRYSGNGITNPSVSNYASGSRTASAAQPHQPGLFDEIWHRVRGEIKQLSEAAITTLSQSLRENLNQGIGHLVETAAAFAAGSAQGSAHESEENRSTGTGGTGQHRVCDNATAGLRG